MKKEKTVSTTPRSFPMGLKERRRRSQIVPTVLKQRRHLTKAELAAADYTLMGDKPHYMEVKLRSGKQVVLPFARYFDPVGMQDIGVFDKLAEIQRMAFQTDFRPQLARISKAHNPSHEALKGTTYDLGATVQPGHGNDGIQLGGLAKTNDPEIKHLTSLVAQVGSCMVKNAFPPTHSTAEIRERRWMVGASLTIGHKDNHEVTSIQINFSMLNQELVDAIKEVGKVHNDGKDDRPRFTALLFLPYFPKNHFPGRFLITTARLACTACPFSGLVFSGTHAHFATGMGAYDKSINIDSPLRYHRPAAIQYPKLPPEARYGRVAIVAYPKRCLVRLNPRAMRAQDFEDDVAALAHFCSQRNMQEFRLRAFVKMNPAALKDSPVTPDALIQKFSWVNDHGETEYPRRELATAALHYALNDMSTNDPEWKELNDAVEKISCGSSFPNEVGKLKKKSTKCGEEEWIDVGVPAPRYGDEVPGSIDWIGLERSTAFLGAKLKRKVGDVEHDAEDEDEEVVGSFEGVHKEKVRRLDT
ncbi:hypothetical protein ONS95_001408 [Cadophora gregata]|uniref:uncharacterized protein n=1 Tax=Cadophora gregata TaxID=51156 RepID=UPI0026DC0D0A|nr:uncharacterized protein ONS95_001408 [Cadophora gregata]KAK0111028.1 hypothetical protein ONS95_001408 [Cadophora gregata]KAK0112512.1 hypothetical protein ONS96_001748 [Cadophora gregata f. sp. sojae]